MKKRLLAAILSIVMVLTMFPVTVWAAKAPDWQPSYLNEMERGIYDAIAEGVEERAVTGGAMIFTLQITEPGLSFDNGGETDEENLKDSAMNYFQSTVSTTNILTCLVNDYPYEMFWYDKMSIDDVLIGLDFSTEGNTTFITKVSYYFPVYETYQDPNAAADRKQYTLSVSQAQRAADAAAYAQQIVDDNAGKSDRDKLEAYKNAICELVSYDQETADIISKDPSSPLYGDPFQIISVFDQDPDTNVVEEGYAKAFQYLCDLSDFDSAQCYTVVGNTAVDSTAQDGIAGNMYNIVRLEGQNYLVDVCFTDKREIDMFMATPESGNIQDGYHFQVSGYNVHYIYSAMYRDGSFFPESVLDLMKKYLTGSVSVIGISKIGETLKTEVTGTPDDAVLSYQWYRDGVPVSGANQPTYTLAAAEDVGKQIKVRVSADGYEGFIESNTTSTVLKADAEPVQEIEIISVTGNSITIATHTGEEYSCVEFISPEDFQMPTQWQDGGDFTGLVAGKVYAIFARRKETPTHYATQPADYQYTVATTSTNTILRIELTIDQPVKYQPLPSSVTIHTANMTAEVEWYEGEYAADKTPVTGNAKPNQQYTARVTMKANQGYSFGKGCYVKVNDTEATLPDEYDGTTAFYMNINFSQPTEPVELESISVTTLPNKTAYYEGEAFDPAGMVVTAYYDDGTSAPVEGYTWDPQTLTIDTTAVTIQYEGKTAQVAVSVQKRELVSISVTQQPDKTVYYDGDSFDPTGMVVTARYNNGSDIVVPLEECVFTPDPLTQGTTEVTVSYGGKTATIAVMVKPPRTLTGIEITTPPTKTEYYVGESFDPAGIAVTALYDDGSTEQVDWADCTFAPEEMEWGTTEVTVSYDGKTAEVAVTVKRNSVANVGMSLTAPMEGMLLDKSIAWDSQGSPAGIADAQVSWYKDGAPVSGRAELGVVYTVKITLTASEDYEFTADFAATINEETATVTVAEDGRTAVVAWIFPPATSLPEGLISITEQYFPDETLRALLSDKFDADKDGALSEQERNSVTAIIVSDGYQGKKVTDLTGIEYFPNLTTLHCNGSQLTELDLSQNPLLEILYCNYNQLTALDLSNNTNLTTLDCSNNQLRTLDLSKNTKLKNLYCEYNQLTQLDVSKNGDLGVLWCECNQLTQLDLSNNPLLEILYCNNNQLTKLDISKSFNLEELSCHVNQLRELDLSNNQELTTWRNYHTQTTTTEVSQQADGGWSLDVADLVTDGSRIEKVVCEADGVTIEGTTVSWNKAYTSLAVTYQYDTRAVPYQYDTSNGFMTVDLTLYPEHAISEAAFPDAAFRQYVSDHMDQNGDGILTKAEREAVTEIDVEGGYNGVKIEDLTGIEYFPNMTRLDCSGNTLTRLDLSANTKLEELNCSDQTLTVDVAPVTDQNESFDLLTLFDDWSRVGNLNVQGATLANDGKTVIYDSTATSITVAYQYDTRSNNENSIMSVTLTLYPQQVISEERFPDAAFRQYVLDHIDTDGDGILTKTEREAVTEIDVEGGYNGVKIADLTGIGYFPNLTKLNCSGNTLTKLDVSANTKLEELSCSNQELTVDVASATDHKWSFNLSTLLDDWSRVSNVRVQNAALESDGKTVSWQNGAKNPIVQYDYRVDDHDTIITVTLTLSYTPEVPPYIPSVPDKESEDTEDTEDITSDGWKQLNSGEWYYYQDGETATGWLKDGTTWYYLEESGKMASGWQKVDDTWYYLKDWGGMATGWQYVNDVWYYLKDWGRMATGWQYINGAWYYLKDWGGMAYNTTIDGYYLGADGAMR